MNNIRRKPYLPNSDAILCNVDRIEDLPENMGLRGKILVKPDTLEAVSYTHLKITQKVADEIASSVRTSLLSHGFNYPVFLTSKSCLLYTSRCV